MIVVADTSPLHYLILIDEAELLPDLFGKVLVPSAVSQELLHPNSPAKVSHWMSHPPEWLEVHAVAAITMPSLLSLDPGEREAIQLALDLRVGTILIYETVGRHIAESLHLHVRGTLGILERNAKLGRTDFRQALSRLEQTSFRLSPAVRAAFLRRNP